ncbi:uncharacterized protein BP5553_00985 [Venustampulla echinocandica]|uniref:SH3 domain-containing protein n=1 Tax=Venustampulla echinocandica TaxID=2656787 RepID=A0A370TZQ5_9HELO|nr:uncharacterized protein BP5553_00985 [Venustampulla echinocandica]RDL41006.1 hypothetical protein BP5553_00985 [Venustampulla echinocandica]
MLQRPRLKPFSTTPAAAMLASITASPLLMQHGRSTFEGSKVIHFNNELGLGLGINFYDAEGNLKSTPILKSKGEGQGEGEGEQEDAVGVDVGSGSGSGSSLNSTATAEAQHPQEAASSSPRATDADAGTNTSQHNISLIDDLLRETYRAQAETFVRCGRSASTSTSVRSFLQTLSGGSTSSHGKSPLLAPETLLSIFPLKRPAPKPNVVAIERSKPLVLVPQQFSVGESCSIRTPSGRVVVQSYSIRSGLSPSRAVPNSPFPYTIYGHRFFSVPTNASPTIVDEDSQKDLGVDLINRGPFYFTPQERRAIQELVLSNPQSCNKHRNCTDCQEVQYSYLENIAMPTSIPPDDRQKIINSNRALRNIKNELENLAENGAISDEAYDTIMNALPAESPLNGPAARAHAAPSASATPAPPTNAFSNVKGNNDPPPPAYTSPSTPSLPSRGPSSKPEISRATALYRYAEPGDCGFEVGDEIAVYEHMNADWWHGKNIRTGQEGVFPVNYVQVKRPDPAGSGSYGSYGNEKANAYPGGYQQQQQQGPPPPGPSNPYNSAVPPMQIAEEPTENKPGKGQEMGKKFGKKLGNAAIFGAGATIGGNLVNSIF